MKKEEGEKSTTHNSHRYTGIIIFSLSCEYASSSSRGLAKASPVVAQSAGFVGAECEYRISAEISTGKYLAIYIIFNPA